MSLTQAAQNKSSDFTQTFSMVNKKKNHFFTLWNQEKSRDNPEVTPHLGILLLLTTLHLTLLIKNKKEVWSLKN